MISLLKNTIIEAYRHHNLKVTDQLEITARSLLKKTEVHVHSVFIVENCIQVSILEEETGYNVNPRDRHPSAIRSKECLRTVSSIPLLSRTTTSIELLVSSNFLSMAVKKLSETYPSNFSRSMEIESIY